ncbi:MAG: dual specificity protein phosphatase family protein [Candidatus Odyssella sp.]|nr:dual specificity protein phosphatase family protein [Candidatus Odyssella sp.]
MQRALPASAYWIEPQRLAAGAYPAAPFDLAVLIAAGIGGFVDLTPAGDHGGYASEAARLARAAGREALHRRFPIRDFGLPEIATMRAILDAIDGWLAARRPVYVHCHAGLGRTGTVVACWLVRHGRAPADALAELQRLRHGTRDAAAASPETDAQRAFVESWRPGN